MSFFDSVKKSLGISKSSGANGRSDGAVEAFKQFEVTFTEEKLGIGISKHTGEMPHIRSTTLSSGELSCPVVTSLDVKKYDVLPGDLIVALEGNAITSFDDFTSIIKAIGRPVKIRFLRRQAASKDTASSVSAPSSGGSSGGGVLSKMLSGMGGSATSAITAAPRHVVVLSEEEKQARREKLSAAAQDRSQTWDRKLGQKKQSGGSAGASAGVAEPQAQGAEPPVSSETEQAIRRAKAAEARIEKELGYSPFRPHMSFSSGSTVAAAAATAPTPAGVVGTATTASASSVPATSGTSTALADPYTVAMLAGGLSAADAEALVAEAAAAEGEVDDALAMLLSLGDADQERGRVAVATVHKMVQNLCDNPAELKLRSIRVSNKAFQGKVATVPGAPELLLAAGYAYSAALSSSGSGAAEAEGSVPGPPSAGPRGGAESPAPTAAPPAAPEGAGEVFLMHPMDPPSVRRLHYTLHRVQELLSAAEGGGMSPTASASSSPRPKS